MPLLIVWPLRVPSTSEGSSTVADYMRTLNRTTVSNLSQNYASNQRFTGQQTENDGQVAVGFHIS